MPQPFADRLCQTIIAKGNFACIGLDPQIEKFPEAAFRDVGVDFPSSVSEAAAAVIAINQGIIRTIYDLVPVIKLQSAFYERLGPAGLLAMKSTIDFAKAHELVVIIDAKRNDVEHVSEIYAEAYLSTTGTELSWRATADAITVNPYLGIDTLKSFADVCMDSDAGIFVVTRTSNPSGRDIQRLETEHGSIASVVAQMVCSLNLSESRLGESGFGPVGMVVGATVGGEGKCLRDLSPHSILLVPGYGVQGGSLRQSVNLTHENGLGVIINSSRGILYGDAHGGTYLDQVHSRVRGFVVALGETCKMQGIALP